MAPCSKWQVVRAVASQPPSPTTHTKRERERERAVSIGLHGFSCRPACRPLRNARVGSMAGDGGHGYRDTLGVGRLVPVLHRHGIQRQEARDCGLLCLVLPARPALKPNTPRRCASGEVNNGRRRRPDAGSSRRHLNFRELALNATARVMGARSCRAYSTLSIGSGEACVHGHGQRGHKKRLG